MVLNNSIMFAINTIKLTKCQFCINNYCDLLYKNKPICDLCIETI